MLDKIVTVGISPNPIVIPVPEISFMEMWNPTVSDLRAIIPYLEEHRKILYVWCYGFTDSPDYDYTRVYSNRIVIPMWLGKTQEEAYELYAKSFKHLVSGTVLNDKNWSF